MTVCLDAFALLAWVQDDAHADAVEGYLAHGRTEGESRCLISALNLGEVYHRLARVRGEAAAVGLWEDARSGELGLAVVELTLPRVRAAARLKAQHPISFADAFAVATALEHRLPLVTGDPEILGLEGVLGLELVRLSEP
jgi:predicted nucleic acid-binding protein